VVVSRPVVFDEGELGHVDGGGVDEGKRGGTVGEAGALGVDPIGGGVAMVGL
jgi:hypothetical protein